MDFTAADRKLVQETHTAVTQLAARAIPCRQDVMDLKLTLYGNGRKGLVTKVDRIWFGILGLGSLIGLVATVYAVIK